MSVSRGEGHMQITEQGDKSNVARKGPGEINVTTTRLTSGEEEKPPSALGGCSVRNVEKEDYACLVAPNYQIRSRKNNKYVKPKSKKPIDHS